MFYSFLVTASADVTLTDKYNILIANGTTNHDLSEDLSMEEIRECTSLRAAFGYNEAKMAIDFYLYNEQPVTPQIFGGKAWRYSEDFVIYDRSFV